MLLTRDYIDPRDLTGYVREALADREQNRFSLNRWLPNRPINDLVYRFARGGQGLIEAATFRAWDAESPIHGRGQIQRVSGELPPISRKLLLTEYDQLRLRGAPDDEVVGQILSDAVTLVRAIAGRIELARGEALTTGAIRLEENGLVAEVDFGRDPDLTVAPAVPWSDEDATILSDLIAWRDKYEDVNGEPPGAIVTSRVVLARMLRNAEMRSLVSTVAGVLSPVGVLSPAALNDALTAYSLPTITTYDARVKVDGVSTRIIPENTLLMLPAPVDADAWEDTQLGATFWGTTAQALDPDFGIEASEAPGIVAGSYMEKDPPRRWTVASAVGLPVLANPDLSLAADTEPSS